MNIVNVAGEVVATAGSDTEAVRWWLENGRTGDRLADTGELVSSVAELLEIGFRFDGDGCVQEVK